MAIERAVRLSRFILFVDQHDHVELHHTAQAKVAQTDQSTARRLQSYYGFRPLEPDLEPWLEVKVLVTPGTDTLEWHSPLEPSEARLGAAYQRWYWAHEVETQREYRWLGQVVVKMPTDLFFYQELLVTSGGRRVLELGHGRGGGVHFFASVLELLGGGSVVSVDIADMDHGRPQRPQVETAFIRGDAFREETLLAARAQNASYDLVVIDLGPSPETNLRALEMWANAVAPGGTVAVEDLWGLDAGSERRVVQAIDQFLLSRRDFELSRRAAAHPFIKGFCLYRRGADDGIQTACYGSKRQS